MSETVPDYEARALAETDAPTDLPRERLDVRELGPPAPLKDTLERLAATDEECLLVQLNDRVPQHLYPRLTERGYTYETTRVGDTVVTLVWPA